MSTNWKAYHPNFESDLKAMASQRALLKLLNQEVDKIKEGSEQEKISLKTLQVTHQIVMIERSVNHTETHLRTLKSFFSKISPPYDNFKSDLKKNLTALDARYSEYNELFSQRDLIKSGADGAESSPSDWHIDLKTDLTPYEPIVTRILRASRKSETNDSSTKIATDRNEYYPAMFRYADSGDFIRNRFILFWEFDNDAPEKVGRSNYDVRFIMRPIGFGITDDSGYLRQCHSIPDNSKISIETNDSDTPSIKVDYYSDSFKGDIFEYKDDMTSFNPKKSMELFDEWNNNQTTGMSESEYAKYAKITNNAFNSKTKLGFMVYPLDQGPFKTLDLNKLSTMDAPDYPGADQLITIGSADSFDKNFKLHCPLPEWNSRLEEALAELEMHINAFNTVSAPHQQKLQIIERFHTLTDIHLRHTKEKTNAPEEVAKVKLLQELEKLHDGISTRLIFPTQDRPIFYNFANLKKNIDRSAFVLWNLLKSKALKAELQNYLKHTEDKEIGDDGAYPAGPYMEYEPSWGKIFETISKCYAALSSSDIVAKEAWEQDIKEGIDLLASTTKNNDDRELIQNLWRTDLSEKEGYLVFNGDEQKVYDPNDEPPEPKGLFATIVNDYSTAVKPVLDHVVRLPGPPCTLQVIFSCYDAFINQYIHRKVLSRTDQVFHIKLFVGIIRTYNIGKTNIKFRKELYASFSIQRHGSSHFDNAKKSKKNLKVFFDKAGNDGSKSNNRFYGKFKDPVAASAKTVFWAFNLCVMIQGVRAINADTSKSDSRKAIEYANSSFQAIGAIGSGYALASRLTTSLFKKQAFKGAEIALNIADKAAIITGLVSGAISLYDAIQYSEKGETDKALVEYIRATGSIALSVGYILRTKVAKKAITSIGKAIGREVAAAGAGAGTGGVLLVVGTVINIGLFIKDLADIVTALEGIFDKTTTEMAKILWITFQADTNLTFETKNFTTDKRLIARLQDIYDKTPYKTYTEKGMQYGYEHLTIEPIKEIDKLYYDALLDFDGGVTWRELSWRAIVPLYNMQYKPEQIEKIVEMPDFDDDNEYKIRTVKDVIKYYKDAIMQNKRGAKDTIVEINENGATTKFDITDLMQSGENFPPRGQKFFQHEKWDHKLFNTKPNQSHLLDMPEFKDYVSK